MISHSVEETFAVAGELASSLSGGEVICLEGDLGAGKTHFVKGLLAGLGYEGEVTSPTFAMVNEYEGGRLRVAHMDFYRAESAAEILELGWDEMLDDRDAVIAVEWPSRFPELFEGHEISVQLSHCEGGRGIVITKGADAS